MSEAQRERVTWLRYEFEQQLEAFLHGRSDAHHLADTALTLSTWEEVDGLSDELLQHTFWAMQHVTHRPACWAPKREEVEYLLLCLRGEEDFSPDQVDFSYPDKPC
jgi:hypothetical protein